MASLGVRHPPSPACSTDGEDYFSTPAEHMRSEDPEQTPILFPARDVNALLNTSPTDLDGKESLPEVQIPKPTMLPEEVEEVAESDKLAIGAIPGVFEDEDDTDTPTVSKFELHLPLASIEPRSREREEKESTQERSESTDLSGISETHRSPEPTQPIESQISFDYDENEDGEEVEIDGDGFDDFGEVVEGEEFDDFEGFEEADSSNDFGRSNESIQQNLPPSQPTQPQIPTLDFSQFVTKEDALDGISSLVSKLYPPSSDSNASLKPLRTSTMFLNERSESLWHQLVAPPPLQPPDWKRSRIRRLFLVSLGVPVDLDEILPASKQKKLVLPSTRRSNSTSRHSSSYSRRNSTEGSGVGRSKSRLRERGNGDSGSRAPSSSRTGKRRDKSISPPDFDMSAARILCLTSDVALANFTPQELRDHISTLQHVTNTASEVLTYWLKKKDGATNDKETFETVIESLVGYARKTRQSMR